MQSVSSRIWTRIAVFISYGDNDYTTGTSFGSMKVVGALTSCALLLSVVCDFKASQMTVQRGLIRKFI